MDSRINQVMEATMKQNESLLSKLEPLVTEKLTGSIEHCFEKNTNNPDRFVSCVQEKSKKVQELMKPFEYKIMYISRHANECLVKGNSVKECQNSASKLAKEIIESNIRAIAKI